MPDKTRLRWKRILSQYGPHRMALYSGVIQVASVSRSMIRGVGYEWSCWVNNERGSHETEEECMNMAFNSFNIWLTRASLVPIERQSDGY